MNNPVVTTQAEVTEEKKSLLRKILSMREFTIFLIVILISIAMAIASPYFLTLSNMRVIINGFAVDMIIAVGMTIALVGGHIDFSVGSILGICGFTTGMLMIKGVNITLSIIIGMLTGIVLGFINGIIIVRFKVLPMVATMGTWMAYKGLGLMLINNSALANLPREFKAIGQKWQIFGIPFNVIVMIAVVVLGIFALKYITFFHQAYFIGGNIQSARLSGIKVNRFIVVMYMITGLLCAVSGILLISRFGSAPASLGQGAEFRIVTALLIGGISFNGGEGSILGALLGTVLMGMITNALALFNISANLQLVIVGAILIISVALDEANRRRKEGK